MVRTIDEALIYSMISGIQYNYPAYDCTSAECCIEGCACVARGGGICAECYEKKLAEIVGDDLARQLHDAVKAKADAVAQIAAFIESNGLSLNSTCSAT